MLGLICTYNIRTIQIHQLLHMLIFFSHLCISSVSVCKQVQRDVRQAGNGTENEGPVFLRAGYQCNFALINQFD